MIVKNKQELIKQIKQLNTKGREKSLNQTLLAYIDLCVSIFIYCLLFDNFPFSTFKIILGMLWFSK